MNLSLPNDEERRQRTIAKAWDIGLPAGLLLALLIVWGADRLFAEHPRVDLVFILDQRSSMMHMIDPMKANVLEKAKEFAAGDPECRFAVVPFGGDLHRIPEIELTSDLAEFEQRLAAPIVDRGSATAPSTVSDALNRASAMNFRADAAPLFLLISEAPCRDPSEVAEAANRMRSKGVTAIVQADAAERDRCLPLYQDGGRFFSMEGDDLTGSSSSSSSDGARSQARAANLLSGLSFDAQARMAGPLKGIYGVRTAPDRPERVKKLGGSDESERAVQEGLNWLARHQSKQGWWSDQGLCEQQDRCPNLKYSAPTAETGLAILAFQAGGHYYFNDRQYSENVARGLDWLVRQQQEDGRIAGQHFWYEHGIATFALAEACAVARANDRAPDPHYLRAATRAVKFMEDHQYGQGGWRYVQDSSVSGDASVTGWQVLALKSAIEAKIDVAPQTMERVQRFFEELGDTETGRTGYAARGDGTDLTTAVGLIVQGFILKRPDSPMARQAAAYLQGQAANLGPNGDFYTLYNGMLAMFLVGGEPWKEWNRAVRDAIIARQIKTGCSRGSWNHRYHQTLDTAWAVLALEVYYRYAAAERKAP